MTHELNYISSSIINKIINLIDEKIDEIENQKSIEERQRVAFKETESLGILMMTTMYAEILSGNNKSRSHINNGEVNQISKVENQTLNAKIGKLKRIKKDLGAINRLDFIMCIYFFIIKENGGLINHVYKNYKFMYITLLDLQSLTKEFKIHAPQCKEKIVPIFVCFLKKYGDIFSFLNNSKSDVHSLLNESVDLKTLTSYIKFSNKSFDEIKHYLNENNNVITYANIICDIVLSGKTEKLIKIE